MRHILIRPLISEKSMGLIDSSFYTFEVDKEATKLQIAKLVAEKFSVTPQSVKIINLPGKRKQQRTRKGYYQTSGSKKAVVRLKAGQKIALFEQAPTEEEVEIRTAEGKGVAKVKEKKSLLRGTKVKIEQAEPQTEEKRGQEDLKTSHKESKKKGVK